MILQRLVGALLPLGGVALALLAWSGASGLVPDLPSPLETWSESRLYILEPLTKRGEMDQGILLCAYYRSSGGREILLAPSDAARFLPDVSPHCPMSIRSCISSAPLAAAWCAA